MNPPSDLRLSVPIQVEGEETSVHYINSGVPHVVVPVSRADMVHVRGRGAAIRNHKMFSPKGANVNFIEKRGPKQIAIRTYERGVEDETLACGTGVVASALIFAATENVDGPIGVLVRGRDELQVGFDKIAPPSVAAATSGAADSQFRNVTLTGPAEFVFQGEIEI